jgi:hypothetical protein
MSVPRTYALASPTPIWGERRIMARPLRLTVLQVGVVRVALHVTAMVAWFAVALLRLGAIIALEVSNTPN